MGRNKAPGLGSQGKTSHEDRELRAVQRDRENLMAQEMVTCPLCGGSGKVAGTRCRLCGGSGQVPK